MIQNILLYLKKKTGAYKWERIGECPLCGGGEFTPYLKRHYGLLNIELESCCNCSLIVQNPRLTRESLDNFYHGEYRFRFYRCLNERHSEELFERGLRRGSYICEYLETNGVEYKGATLFEVGCSYGGILGEFKRRGCRIKGCDLNPLAVWYGVSKGLDLIVGSVDRLADLDLKADLIILSHVFEHITDPKLFLKKVRNALNPNGIVYIEVPGIKSEKVNIKRMAQVSHLLFFDSQTLRRMIEESGFEFIAGNEMVQAISRKREA